MGAMRRAKIGKSREEEGLKIASDHTRAAAGREKNTEQPARIPAFCYFYERVSDSFRNHYNKTL
jgi:hypothetical protein